MHGKNSPTKGAGMQEGNEKYLLVANEAKGRRTRKETTEIPRFFGSKRTSPTLEEKSTSLVEPVLAREKMKIRAGIYCLFLSKFQYFSIAGMS